MEVYEVVHTQLFENGVENWKFAIPQTLLPQLTLNWYHLVSGHIVDNKDYTT